MAVGGRYWIYDSLWFTLRYCCSQAILTTDSNGGNDSNDVMVVVNSAQIPGD